MCTTVNRIDITISKTGNSALSLKVQGEHLIMELSPGMAAVMLAALRQQADAGQFDPQMYKGIELRLSYGSAAPTPPQTRATAHR